MNGTNEFAAIAERLEEILAAKTVLVVQRVITAREALDSFHAVVVEECKILREKQKADVPLAIRQAHSEAAA